jgi:hypothetical protein
MGFKVNKKELVIKFSDMDYEGLEVVARYPSIKEAMEFQKLAAGDLEQEKNLLKVYDFLAKFIIRWNLEDDSDKAMPISAKTFFEIPMELTNAIQTGFVQGAFGISAPLDGNSLNGESLQELHVPMEAL